MSIRRLAILLFCVLTAARAEAQFNVSKPAAGEQFHVELGLMFWTPTPGIKIQTAGLAALGTAEVDFVQEFAIEDTRFSEFHAVLKAGRKHKIRISHVPMEYDVQNVLQRTVTFGGVSYPVSVLAAADLKWELWRFGYEWDFVAADRGVVGLVTEIQVNKVSAQLSAAGYATELTDVSAPVPTLGVLARVYPHRLFAITAEFTGFKVPGFIGKRITDTIGNNFDAKVFDMDISGTLSFGKHVGVQGGYRSLSANYLFDNDSGDLEMKGPYFGGVVRF